MSAPHFLPPIDALGWGEMAQRKSTGGQVGRTHETPGEWHELVEAAGGPSALADLVGCSRMSINNWVQNRKPMTEISKTAVRAVAERLGVKSPV